MGQGAVAPPPSGPMGLPYTRAMPSCTSLLRLEVRIRASARVAAEKVRRAVAAAPIDADGQDIGVTITIGGAVDPSAGDAVHDVIDRADKALYKGKRDGRNRVVFNVDADA